MNLSFPAQVNEEDEDLEAVVVSNIESSLLRIQRIEAKIEERVGLRSRAGQDKRAKFPTSKAHISAVFHSFRLIFGRAIISRNGLEAWMLFL